MVPWWLIWPRDRVRPEAFPCGDTAFTGEGFERFRGLPCLACAGLVDMVIVTGAVEEVDVMDVVDERICPLA